MTSREWELVQRWITLKIELSTKPFETISYMQASLREAALRKEITKLVKESENGTDKQQ